MVEKKEDGLAQMQLIQQNLQNILMQKQQFQMQLNEFTSALSELKTTEKAYRIVGNLMVASQKEDLEKELKNKVQTIELRLKTLEAQEDKFRQRLSELQKNVASGLKKE